VPAGLGTDTGGSTRIPAALTGIAGFRPSVGNGGASRRYHDPLAVVPISHTRDTVGPMARSVADIALLDQVITGSAPLPPMDWQGLQGLRIGLPAPLWQGLAPDVEAVARAALLQLQAAGVVWVDMAMPELLDINSHIGAPLALHESVDDLPAWLAANGAQARTVADIAARIASPDVRDLYQAVLADEAADQYDEAMTVWRPRLQQCYATAFATHRVDALLFPTTRLAAVPLDEVNGSSTVSIQGAEAISTFEAFLRNTDPASNAGLPGLSLPAGMTPQGLPVGIELDGPEGSDRRLLAIGVAFEQVLGLLAAPHTAARPASR
jgi:mandelamide amidase